jgi:hypothetical protein
MKTRPWSTMNWLEKTMYVIGIIVSAWIIWWLFVMVLAFFTGYWGALLGLI